VTLLLDTHLLLWAVSMSGRLPERARRLIEDGSNEVLYSSASIWEIAINASLPGRALTVDVPALLDALPAMGLRELPVRGEHAARAADLPAVHRDPFDRLLVAQSLVEPATLLTNDVALEAYGPTVLAV
jgi:PIN domain nuclease of toxin-antitoxin system